MVIIYENEPVMKRYPLCFRKLHTTNKVCCLPSDASTKLIQLCEILEKYRSIFPYISFDEVYIEDKNLITSVDVGFDSYQYTLNKRTNDIAYQKLCEELEKIGATID